MAKICVVSCLSLCFCVSSVISQFNFFPGSQSTLPYSQYWLNYVPQNFRSNNVVNNRQNFDNYGRLIYQNQNTQNFQNYQRFIPNFQNQQSVNRPNFQPNFQQNQKNNGNTEVIVIEVPEENYPQNGNPSFNNGLPNNNQNVVPTNIPYNQQNDNSYTKTPDNVKIVVISEDDLNKGYFNNQGNFILNKDQMPINNQGQSNEENHSVNFPSQNQEYNNKNENSNDGLLMIPGETTNDSVFNNKEHITEPKTEIYPNENNDKQNDNNQLISVPGSEGSTESAFENKFSNQNGIPTIEAETPPPAIVFPGPTKPKNIDISEEPPLVATSDSNGDELIAIPGNNNESAFKPNANENNDDLISIPGKENDKGVPNHNSEVPEELSPIPGDTTTELPFLTPVPVAESRDNANFGTQGIFRQVCQTVDGGAGSCVVLAQCTQYDTLLKNGPRSAAIKILREAHCGFEGDYPKVCCPKREIPTGPPPTSSTSTITPTTTTTSTTTSTTTTTTTTTAAPESRELETDFLPLPDPPICGVSNGSFGRVVGGFDAKLGDFPWMALLGYRRKNRPTETSWLCGGSLITNKHILTAAHCIHGNEQRLYVVRLGELDLSRENEGAVPVDALIKDMIKHEEYNPNTYTNDIGLLVLDREIPFTDLIKPICIPKTPQLRSNNFEDYMPFIAGWGDTEFHGPSSPLLQAVQLPVVSNERCARAYRQYKSQNIDEKVLCAGYEKGGKDACQGDSGGPLMQPVFNRQDLETFFYQIGVVSFGRRCADAGFPGVYSRVTHFMPWIQDKVSGPET